jgi:hypothetical protein
MVGAVVTTTVAGCGQAKHAPVRDPAEAVRVLQRQGYTYPTLPGASPGTRVARFGGAGFNIRNGQPIAYLYKDNLHVMIVRGDSHTERVPGTLWYRSGDTILIGWLSKGNGPSGRAQFNALVEAL